MTDTTRTVELDLNQARILTQGLDLLVKTHGLAGAMTCAQLAEHIGSNFKDLEENSKSEEETKD